MIEYDVVVVSDFRLPGGTNKSTAQELAVHRRAGIRTGLIHCHSRLSRRPLPWSAAILDQLEPGLIEPLRVGTPAKARLAVLRHPIALEGMPDVHQLLKVDAALIIANQTAMRPDGQEEYDASLINRTVQERLGVAPVWAPIGPVVRNSLNHWNELVLREEDWTNIFADAGVPPQRGGFQSERPRIGRHSRPQPAKWPADAQDIRDAYPAGNHCEVRILGGVSPAIDVLGELPESWMVHEFGSLEPLDFLEQVDFWVYFHHPQWLEAYGRAIMEALWSGAVVILPPYLESTYGEAAIYGSPSDVEAIINSFVRGQRSFVEQSLRGQAFAASHSGENHLKRVREILDQGGGDIEMGVDHPPSAGFRTRELQPPVWRMPSPPASGALSAKDQPTALFITSNGAGMGHLTRMLGLARNLSPVLSPVFFSMSQGVGVAAQADIPFEYVPYNSALETKSELWHTYFHQRFEAALDHYQARAVIFDGTWPYRGLLQVLKNRSIMKVWVRRGMWKPTISPEQLRVSTAFDLVIEPGDYARAYDVGATSRVTDAHRVSPMTLLSPGEELSRGAAREELGLSRDRNYALITLGAGNINDVGSLQQQFVSAIESIRGWDAIITKVPISFRQSEPVATSISTFPLARYARAFDFTVSAAGYNSFSEWMGCALPTIWVPNLETITDDQDARARWAEDSGLGLRITTGSEAKIAQAVGRMALGAWRRQVEERLQQLTPPTGAQEAAAIISEAWNLHSNGRW